MGLAVADVLGSTPGFDIIAGVERPGHPDLGRSFGSGRVESDLAVMLDRADAVVDFAGPGGLRQRVECSAQADVAYICGVTGLDAQDQQSLHDAGNRVAVVYAPNFSVGVNALYRLVVQAARLLGAEYDAEVVETHHRLKRDAPSGTARHIVELLRQATGRDELTMYGREGQVGEKPVAEIGVHSVRTGDVVGEHVVVFGGPGERLEITHRATSRAAFVTGVVAALRFVETRGPGCYAMSDVLGADRKL
jgi:4-hydroxy-tetrahydrodipicolinate reductase